MPQKYKDDDMKKKIWSVWSTDWRVTSVGGEILQAEVAVVEGTGKLELTGSLGDVMKESARAAITCVRGLCDRYGIDKNFYKEKDIHIHFPEGAVPKDAPSAGVTITTALVSALSGMPVRHDVAMTGEITLRGRVLPIGGLKEKTMAAYRNGMKTVIIPQVNEPNLYEAEPDGQGKRKVCDCERNRDSAGYSAAAAAAVPVAGAAGGTGVPGCSREGCPQAQPQISADERLNRRRERQTHELQQCCL